MVPFYLYIVFIFPLTRVWVVTPYACEILIPHLYAISSSAASCSFSSSYILFFLLILLPLHSSLSSFFSSFFSPSCKILICQPCKILIRHPYSFASSSSSSASFNLFFLILLFFFLFILPRLPSSPLFVLFSPSPNDIMVCSYCVSGC